MKKNQILSSFYCQLELIIDKNLHDRLLLAEVQQQIILK